ncbi:ABC transporter permease [Microbacterium sp. CFBP9034]|uniref:ABC transporter permease n=1 Tax=Microbacterium sp. CFBP9034 TaxID=3096540 RepID=UPI002A69CBB3|nr:ABC transporter permease [Microbacterium sp. CFBP9034]MDY0910973.1 ABC transporter permease [Microbacterium sp. CFBP9034]
MIGGSRFAIARARAAAAPLVTLAVVAALAALLIVGVAGLVSSVETREVRAALSAATGDRARVVLSVEEGASADAVADAVAGALAADGGAGALRIGVEDGDVVLTPDLDAVTSGQALALADAIGGLRDAVEERTGDRPQTSGGLPATLDAVRDGIGARRGPTAVALGLLGLLTAVVVGAVALEAVRAREGESLLLRARGARGRDLVRLAAVETAAVALVGASAGAVLGALLVALWSGTAPDVVVSAVAAAGIVVVAALVVAVATSRGVDRGSSRARTVADVGAVILLAVITGLAVWQFVRAGTPVVERGDGATVLDPLVAIAPALALGLAALVAVAVATPVARAVAAALAPTRGVSPVTSLRLASRRPARHALSITVVAFAIGTMTVAGAYHASLTALGDAPEALRVGADVKVGTIPEDVPAADVAAAGSPAAAMLARPMNAEGADQRIPILAVEAPQLGEVMLDGGGILDPVALGGTLALPDTGAPLAGDDVSLTLLAPASPALQLDDGEVVEGVLAFQVRVTAVSASGAVASFAFSNADLTVDPDPRFFECAETAARAVETAEFELPDAGPWSLAAVDVAFHPFSCFPGTAEISELRSGGEALDVADFRPAAGTPGSVEATSAGLSFAPEPSTEHPFTRAVAPGVPAGVPTVITSALADSMSLEIGDSIALEIVKPDFEADFEIIDVVPVLPGTVSGQGMLVDLGTLALASPFEIAPTQAWLATDDPGAVAAAVSDEFPQTVAIVADPRSAQNAAGTAWAFYLAAAGAVVLTIVVLVLRRTRSRADSRELALFAVMGLGRRRASRLRAQEDLFAVFVGAVGGITAGAATAWLVVAPLVRAAYAGVPEAYPVLLQADPVALTVAIAVVIAVFAAIVATVRTPAVLAPLMREDE